MSTTKDGLRNRRPTAAAKETINDDYNDQAENGTNASNDNKDGSIAESINPRCDSDPIEVKQSSTIIVVLKWMVHLAAIACFVTGIVLRTSQLHTGEECDMTYSWRIFLKVDTAIDNSLDSKRTTSPATSQYALYKFVDQRDPRYSHLLRKQKTQPMIPLTREEHCANSSGTVVVYVPGHWGTYDQARSLGAHGTQMTRARENSRLAQQKLSSVTTTQANSTKDFIYDVYAVDFAEQGGGLHGRFLQYQTEYLADVLAQLSEDCGTRTLMIVAHSMGGYVARKVLQEHPELEVKNLITLATPHSNPLYAFDRSVADFHRDLECGKLHESFDNKQPLVVSISGGLRDEMIEPSVCEISPRRKASNVFRKSAHDGKENNHGVANAWTVLATRLLEKVSKTEPVNHDGISGLGMDHRAIVWCHQVLEEVRRVLFVLVASSENTVQERVEKVRMALGAGSETFDYTTDVHQMKMRLSDHFGSVLAICVEASMIYNLPYLLALYAALVAFRCARATVAHRSSSMLPLWATILLGWIFRSDIPMLATVILGLVANAFNLLAIWLLPVGFLRRSRGGQREPKTPLRVLRRALVSTLVFMLSLKLVLFILFHFLQDQENELNKNWFDVFASTLYVYSIASIYVLLVVWAGFIENDMARTNVDQNLRYTNSHGNTSLDSQIITFLMLVVPFNVAGSIVLMVWEHGTQASSWATLLSMQVPVGVLVVSRLSQIVVVETEDSPKAKSRRTRRESIQRTPTIVRSISIHLCLVFFCFREPGLFCQGTGYLVPDVAIVLAVVEIGMPFLM